LSYYYNPIFSQWRRKVFIGGVKEALINNKYILHKTI
jgi:hypothetical protein